MKPITSMTTTPSAAELETLIGYPLRKDITVREKPYRCAGCGKQHRYVGVIHQLPTRGGGSQAAYFCVICVADGSAYREVTKHS